MRQIERGMFIYEITTPSVRRTSVIVGHPCSTHEPATRARGMWLMQSGAHLCIYPSSRQLQTCQARATEGARETETQRKDA